jgi:hypothetical protein
LAGGELPQYAAVTRRDGSKTSIKKTACRGFEIQILELCMATQALHRLITLAAAARSFDPPINAQVLRGALDRLGILDKDERGHRVVPLNLVNYLKSERKRSGYLHPRGARLPEILAACAGEKPLRYGGKPHAGEPRMQGEKR